MPRITLVTRLLGLPGLESKDQARLPVEANNFATDLSPSLDSTPPWDSHRDFAARNICEELDAFTVNGCHCCRCTRWLSTEGTAHEHRISRVFAVHVSSYRADFPWREGDFRWVGHRMSPPFCRLVE